MWTVDRYEPAVFDYDGTKTFAALFTPARAPRMIVSFRQPLPPWITGTYDLPIASSVAGGPHPDPITDIVDDVSKAYDAVLYVETTTPSLPLP